MHLIRQFALAQWYLRKGLCTNYVMYCIVRTYFVCTQKVSSTVHVQFPGHSILVITRGHYHLKNTIDFWMYQGCTNQQPTASYTIVWYKETCYSEFWKPQKAETKSLKNLFGTNHLTFWTFLSTQSQKSIPSDWKGNTEFYFKFLSVKDQQL